MSLKSLLNEDPVYERFIRIRDTALASISTETILREAEFLHSNRKARKLNGSKLSPNAVMEALANELSNRSRLAELRVSVMKSNELLSTALSSIKRHIRVKYDRELRELGSTQNDRVAVLDRLLGKSNDFKAQLDHLESVLDVYIKDIDQSAFNLRNTTELLKLFLDRRATEI